MSEKKQSSPIRQKLPLQGVTIFVSQQLVSSRMILHQQCTSLGGKFVWVFDVPFTHYICQGKLSKKAKEYKKAEEYRAACVHPAWLKACYTFGQRIAEKLYATTYDPNRSLSFVSVGDEEDDEDEENHIPSLTSRVQSVIQKPVELPISIVTTNRKKKIFQSASLSNLPVPKKVPLTKTPSQPSNEAETMLNDLESSLAQFLNNNAHTNSNRPSKSDEETSRKSLPTFRSVATTNTNKEENDAESTMRVEWLDDAMQAERQKIVDEDESNINSQRMIRNELSSSAKKRPLLESNCDRSFNAKKFRM